MLIEVAESSLRYDRSTKLRLYADAGIPEYWLIDCAAESVDVFRTPEGGTYREVTRLTGTGILNVRAFADVSLTLTELFT